MSRRKLLQGIQLAIPLEPEMPKVVSQPNQPNPPCCDSPNLAPRVDATTCGNCHQQTPNWHRNYQHLLDSIGQTNTLDVALSPSKGDAKSSRGFRVGDRVAWSKLSPEALAIYKIHKLDSGHATIEVVEHHKLLPGDMLRRRVPLWQIKVIDEDCWRSLPSDDSSRGLKVGDRYSTDYCGRKIFCVVEKVRPTGKRPITIRWEDTNKAVHCNEEFLETFELCSNTLTSSPELEDSPKQQNNSEESKQLSSSNAIQTLSSCCDRVGQTFPFTATCACIPLELENSTFLPLAFLAPEPAAADCETGCFTQSRLCGGKPLEPSFKGTPDLLLSKIQKGLSTEDLEKSLPLSEWQAIRGTIRSSYQRLLSALPKSAKDCLLCPTPTVSWQVGRNCRPAGGNKLITWFKKNGLLENGLVLNAEIVELLQGFPKGWTQALEFCPGQESTLEGESCLAEQSSQNRQRSHSAEFSICPSCQQPLLNPSDGCGICGWFTTVPWNEQGQWKNEPLDQDDVWTIGDRVRWKHGLHQEGTIKGKQPRDFLGGKLNYLIVRWDNAESDVIVTPEEIWRLTFNQADNPLELKRRKSRGASGTLYPYIKNKRLKSGFINSYPRVEGHRDPDNVRHWFWGYSYEERTNTGWRTKKVSVQASKVLAVRSLIQGKKPVEQILKFIKGE